VFWQSSHLIFSILNQKTVKLSSAKLQNPKNLLNKPLVSSDKTPSRGLGEPLLLPLSVHCKSKSSILSETEKPTTEKGKKETLMHRFIYEQFI
jgi:hypothetical protein